MISVVIPTLDADNELPATLAALVPGAVEGLIGEVIVVDGGSGDRTRAIAEASGARVLLSPRGRGRQLDAGAAAARGPWLLFLHADTRLEAGWVAACRSFMERADGGRRPASAAAFRFALDDQGTLPRLLEWAVGWRCALLRLPYGDQGLLMPARLYRELGGYRPYPLLEDVDLVRRLGRSRITLLDTKAVTSAIRYRRDGYAARVLRNLGCLALLYLRVPPHAIARIYG